MACLAVLLLLARPLAAAGDRFRPSVRGKKLLIWCTEPYDTLRDHRTEIERLPFDGLLLGGSMVFFTRLKESDFAESVARLRAIPLRRLKDNFWIVYEFSGEKPEEFDWFDDCSWVVGNWRLAARAAREAGLKGLAFDPERYAGIGTFAYEGRRYAKTKTREEYAARVRKRGAEIMRAMREEYPGITLLFLFGPSSGGFLADFTDGMLSECGAGNTIIDGFEGAYWNRVPAQFAESRHKIHVEALGRSKVPEQYRRHVIASFGLWDAPGTDPGKGRPFDVKDFERNYRTPEELAYALHSALAYSDRYVWMWHSLDWLRGTVSTLDEGGKPAVAPIPTEYLRALKVARRPHVPVPRGRTRPPMPGIVTSNPVETWAGWSDEETFGDLWQSCEYLSDLPLEWRFRLDPAEEGERGGWHRPRHKDVGWPLIRIRDFWEAQGYSPYDGAAWYRVWLEAPALPAGKRVYLAFGAVNDGATVYVNGRKLKIAGLGFKAPRFLVDVTDALKPAARNLVAVRVMDMGWVGGIWKSVKLVAAR